MPLILAKAPTPPINNKSTATQHSIFEIILLVVVAGLFYQFLVVPKKAEVAAKVATVESLNGQRDAALSDSKKMDGLASQLAENKDNIHTLDQALPLSIKSTRIYLLFDDLAAQSGVTLQDVNISNPKGDAVVAGDKALLADPFKSKRALEKVVVNFSVTGNLEAFENLLKHIESSGRIINITSVSMDSSGKDQSMTFQLIAELYFYE